jgi:hypothetical protein
VPADHSGVTHITTVLVLIGSDLVASLKSICQPRAIEDTPSINFQKEDLIWGEITAMMTTPNSLAYKHVKDSHRSIFHACQ